MKKSNWGRRESLSRDRLPNPAEYYAHQLPDLKPRGDYATARCPFHDDSHPSLGINLVHGFYRCFACGAYGGDVLAFHRQRYGLDFITAATELEAWQ